MTTASSSPTMFGHLAFRFSASPENLATEALLFLLDSSAAARRGFARAFVAALPDLPDLRYASQSTGSAGERPDLIGVDVEGRERLVLEAKFWAALTDNQPETYLKRLKGQGLLAFVAPEVRGPLLWRELLLRCGGLAENVEEVAEGLCAARVDGVALALISWRRLLACIHGELEAEGDRERIADLKQLVGLCERMDTEAFLPLTREELSSPIYRRVLQLSDIVDAVVEGLAADGLISLKGTRVTPGKGLYVRYLRTALGWSGSIRLDLYRWTGQGGAPLWYDPHPGEKAGLAARRELAWSLTRPLQAAGASVVSGWADFPAIALNTPVGVEQPSVVHALRGELMVLVERFAALASGAEPAPEADVT